MSLTKTVLRFAAPLPQVESFERCLFIGPALRNLHLVPFVPPGRPFHRGARASSDDYRPYHRARHFRVAAFNDKALRSARPAHLVYELP